jgi:hypothetical protein
LQLAAELLATSKAIVMMDGNLSTLNMDVHPAAESSNVSRIIKGSRKEKELQEKNTKRK